MGSDNSHYWEMSEGGHTGSICMDASVATSIATGLQCGLIDIRADTVFTALTAVSVLTSTPINFLVDNGLTGLTQTAGLLWPGYGRYFSEITITSGQIYRYEKRND